MKRFLQPLSLRIIFISIRFPPSFRRLFEAFRTKDVLLIELKTFMIDTSSQVVVSCRNLRFSRGATEVLHGIHFEAASQGIIGLLGKNGAGKSTTIGLLMGNLTPDSGECRLFGEPSHALSNETKARIGILHEGFVQYDFMRIAEVERFYSRFYPRWDESLFWNLVDRMHVPSSRRIAKLSCGQRSQVTLGLLLAQRPDLLILDDFSLGLDVGYRRLFLEFLRDYVDRFGVTVLLTSHVVGELEDFLDRVVVVKKGDILCDLSKDAFLRHFRGWSLPLVEGMPLPAVDKTAVVNIEMGARTVEVFTTMEDDAFRAHLAAAGLERDAVAAARRLTLSFEDIFVGITGRY